MGDHWRRTRVALLCAISACLASGAAGDAHFVGPKACALCHKDIAATQERSAMANTWQGSWPGWLSPSFDASVADDLTYQVTRGEKGLTYAVKLPDRSELRLPIEISMGGKRHGLGFLLPIVQVDGLPLARTALVQARYAWSPERGRLLLAPGCAATRPQTMESTLGLVLSPTFESRCLSCHGQPNLRGTGQDGGVHCESCHGPGSRHVTALGHGNATEGIVNPKRLSTEDSIGVCAQCHVGLARFSDPAPEDLLIANQVRAIRSSECFLQSGKAFSCTACHDPHSDAGANSQRAVNACVGCHSNAASPHAAICPVNAKENCIGCHMPSVDKGPLHLVDHLIRVHPEQAIRPENHTVGLRSQIKPVSEYLRMLTTDSAEAAATALGRIAKGERFYTVARESSVDSSAAIGGYLGRKTLAELGSDLGDRAARLDYGQTSQVVQSGGRWIILQRLPRDFRWNAEQVEREAEDLASRGDAAGAIGKAQEALTIYPHFLRALNLIGTIFVNSGNPKKGVEVLRVATHLYPEDAGTEFALASALGLMGDQIKASAAYKRVIVQEPDFIAAYLNLGMMSYAAGDWRTAISIFRQGLRVDPMCAELYYQLSLALGRSGDASGAKEAMAIAGKLNPALVSADSRNSGRPNRLDSFFSYSTSPR
jgi:tetratricopeptide (TPR) repeat protein